MPLLQPSSCSCYALKLPALPGSFLDADEPVKRKLTLECRTGAAVELTRSDMFVHGGLTIPLNLTQINSLQIQKELMLYFAKEKQCGSLFRKLTDWISPEVFFLDLISRSWKRIETEVDMSGLEDGEVPRLHERFFHSMSFSSSCLYVFGGLVVSPQNGYELIASNELWKLDLTTKKWSLVNKSPQIARRFGHSMHTKNEHIENRDTKLVIVGGLNNMDQAINKVDIYNLTRGFWESEPNPELYKNVWMNVNGKFASHLSESNFSILIENNEAKVPTLVSYGIEGEENTETIKKRSANGAPLFALPLTSESKGIIMNSNVNQIRTNADIPYNLQFPSGSYFSHNVVTGGFYPNCQSSNFQCFVYDIPSGKWAKVGTVCEDRDHHRHRFWRLFVWHSHHKTLLLGTRDDDYNLPSVQKFDWLLSFGLPMITIYNRLLHSTEQRSTILRPAPTMLSRQYSVPEMVSEDLGRPTSNSSDDEDRKLSFASSSTSQFESYIRYIAPPVQMTSISSVFPPYAMVLGKDALEIFGKPLSDFEFITEEGDSIGVPILLLRKRWGRYFDMLLSQGYAKACLEYEGSVDQSDILKLSPRSSQVVGSLSKPSDASSSGSLDNSSKQQQRKSGAVRADQDKPEGVSEYMEPPEEHQEDIIETPAYYGNENNNNNNDDNNANINTTTTTTTTTTTNNNNNDDDDDNQVTEEDDDPMSPPAAPRSLTDYKNLSSKSIHRIGTASTTSSSGGMVFRVPFQDSSTASLTDTRPPKPVISKEKRRSSSVASPALDYLKPYNSTNSNYQETLRRASHPDSAFHTHEDSSRSLHPTFRHSINSTRSSRNPSLTSQNSSISFVSSSSDRMGNSIVPQTSNGSSLGSNVLGVLTVPLPPLTSAPNEPLPPAPYEISGRHNSTSEYGVSSRSSPLSSRRASYDRNYSMQDPRFAADNLRTSLDSQVLAENANVESPIDNSVFHKTILAKLNPRSGESLGTSLTRSSGKNSESHRLSLGSNADSSVSVASAGFEWEPLITPRTLYMPWPTATVRAFSEFFYIGQVNGKWPLAPVALNLLVMSKIYEIPLLGDLINEVLYSIIGRKEDSLYVTCNSLMEAIKKKLRSNFSEDESWVESQTSRNENYIELERLKHSLENVDNGYVDLNLLKRVSRSLSISTSESDDLAHGHVADTEQPNTQTGSSHIPTVFAGGPRDSHNSIGSIGYPPGVNFQGSRKSSSVFSPRVKKKSSLSKEVNLDSTDSNTDNSDQYIRSDARKAGGRTNSGFSYFGDTSSHSSFSTSGSDTSNEDHDETANENDAQQDDGDENFHSTIIDARSREGEEVDNERDEGLNELHSSRRDDEDFDEDSNSSLSDLDGLNSDLGLLSLNKMKRKLAGQTNLDESVDPLLKVDSAHQTYDSSNKRDNIKHNKDNFTSSTNNLSLEYLVSPNALPPVDYVIKAIYRAAALVNYPRLMIRCLDCIEISKRLKELKKRITYDLASMDQEMKKNAESSSINSIRDQKFERPNLEWTSTRGSFQGTFSPNLTPKSGTPKIDNSRRGTSQAPPVQLSPSSSYGRDDESIKSSASQPKKFLKSKIFGESPTPQPSTSAFMNPAFMPPPPPSSNKNKKGHSGSSGFSFFGIKK